MGPKLLSTFLASFSLQEECKNSKAQKMSTIMNSSLFTAPKNSGQFNGHKHATGLTPLTNPSQSLHVLEKQED